MFHTRTIEISVGVFIALGIAALFFLAMKVSNLATLTEAEGYEVHALFDNIGGLKVRAPVTMAGVRVGRVKAIGYDEDAFQARVTLAINPDYDRIPVDTAASIYTAGLLGEQYVALEPGGAMEYLSAGSEIRLTQSALVLEQVVGQFLFSQAAGDGGGGSGGGEGDGGGDGGWSAPDPFAP